MELIGLARIVRRSEEFNKRHIQPIADLGNGLQPLLTTALLYNGQRGRIDTADFCQAEIVMPCKAANSRIRSYASNSFFIFEYPLFRNLF